MKALLPLAAVFLATTAVRAAFTPRIELTVKPNVLYVTQTAEAEISFVLPGRLRGNPRISADFIPQNARLQLTQKPFSERGTNFVRYATRVTVPAGEPGRHTLGPVTVSLPAGRRDPFGRRSPFDSFFDDDDFFGGMFQRYADFRSPAVTLEVREPPAEGRPASDIGAIATDLTATSRLNAHVCTAGDPLLLTVEIRATTDFSRVRPPKPPASDVFHPDAASLKTESGDGFKRFTWRVRTRKPATTEFPACAIGWFDPVRATWRTLKTPPIPIQVRAGVQAALGDMDGASESFPVPDGLELDFPQDDFTLRHALSSACRASSEREFKEAAARYRAYLDKAYGASFDFGYVNPFDKTAACRAKHYRNLASLLTLGGQSAEALRAIRHAEGLVGATPGSTRGLRAARAKLTDDPRAELSVARQFFPFFYALPYWGRFLAGLGATALAAIVLLLLGSLGRRRKAVFLFACAFALTASAQFSFPGFGRRMSFANGPSSRPHGSLRLDPARVAVGQPAAFVFTFKTTGKDESVDQLRFGGLPDDGIAYGEIETRPGNEFRLPVRFLRPFSNTVSVVAAGMMTKTMRSGNFTSSSSVNFREAFDPVTIVVEPLPVADRPDGFSGAIGERFRLAQTCEPTRVRPGDLVTVTYVLRFAGYMPSNAVPRIVRQDDDFKVYPLKEVSRAPNAVVWKQMLVPKSAAATNAMTAAVTFYDTAARRYKTATAKPVALAFASAVASSTVNTSVVVNEGETAGGAKAAGGPLVLRFAPTAKAPVVATLPAGTPVLRKGETVNGWQRLETSRAAGWVPLK